MSRALGECIQEPSSSCGEGFRVSDLGFTCNRKDLPF